jgi:hypothetical protein
MNVTEHVFYASFFAENALPMGDCVTSMPLMKDLFTCKTGRFHDGLGVATIT